MVATANPTLSMLIFSVFTLLYIVGDYIQAVGKKTSSVYLIIYALAVIISQFIGNISLTNQLCGSNQYVTALIVTIIPWTLMFGTITFLLTTFPGWLSPFSNTFGYAAALVSGLNNLMNDILIPKIDKNTSKENEAMMETLAHIYSDRSSLINEITISTFDNFWDMMSGLINDEAKKSDSALKNSLFSLVVLKDSVAKFVWFMLAGTLVISVGYNYIINSGCEQSAEKMMQLHSQYEQKLADDNKAKTSTTKRVYTSN